MVDYRGTTNHQSCLTKKLKLTDKMYARNVLCDRTRKNETNNIALRLRGFGLGLGLNFQAFQNKDASIKMIIFLKTPWVFFFYISQWFLR